MKIAKTGVVNLAKSNVQQESPPNYRLSLLSLLKGMSGIQFFVSIENIQSQDVESQSSSKLQVSYSRPS